MKNFEHTDPVTGEVFKSRAENHYEKNDGVPFAPPVTMKRPSLRQRIENLINRGQDPLAHYVGTEGIDMEVPEDGDAPLTPSEQNYLDAVAASIAEQAPLPDEGLPRPETRPASPPPPPAQTPAPAPVSSPAQAAPPAPVPSR